MAVRGTATNYDQAGRFNMMDWTSIVDELRYQTGETPELRVLIEKHLAGKHEQKTHGRPGKGPQLAVDQGVASSESRMDTGPDGNPVQRLGSGNAYWTNSITYRQYVFERAKLHNKLIPDEKVTGTLSCNSREEAQLWIDEFLPQVLGGKYKAAPGVRKDWLKNLRVGVNPDKPTQVIRAKGVKPPKGRKVSFTDLTYLMSGELASDKYPERAGNLDVRAVMSRFTTKTLKDWSRSIASAVNI